jgi:hypothetical protein
MTDQPPTTPVPKRPRRVARFLLIALAGIVVIATAAHLVWKYSGSEEWTLVREQDGIRIWSRKEPGKSHLVFKGITTMSASLDSTVALMLDPQAGGADAAANGGFESLALQPVDQRRGGAGYYSFKWKFPLRFRPRHYVVRATFTQNPSTKEVFETVEAVPGHLPPDDCCVRIARMRNTWRVTPVGNGRLQVEYVLDAPGEGLFPYVLDNLGGDDFVHYTLKHFPKWANDERYANVDIEFISEQP